MQLRGGGCAWQVQSSSYCPHTAAAAAANDDDGGGGDTHQNLNLQSSLNSTLASLVVIF